MFRVRPALALASAGDRAPLLDRQRSRVQDACTPFWGQARASAPWANGPAATFADPSGGAVRMLQSPIGDWNSEVG